LIDRLGALPTEVDNLLEIIAIKRSCRDAGIEKLEAGPKGAVVSLRENRFANPAGLVALMQRHADTLKLRSDQKIVYLRDWHDAKTRLTSAARLAQALAKIARVAPPEAGTLSHPTPGLVMPRAARRA